MRQVSFWRHPKKFLRIYIWNCLIVWDQVLNVMFFFGDPDETVSSHLGRIKEKHGGLVPWYRPLSKFLAWGLNKIETDHCEDAIERDEGGDGLII